MGKPKVKLENYEQVYEYYRSYNPSELATKIGFWAMAKIAKPTVSYDKEAKDSILDLLSSGSRLIVTPNHLNNKDQYVICALARREEPLVPLIGNTVSYAKAELFKNSLVRRGVEIMGGVPVFRSSDVDSDDTQARQTQPRATDALTDMALTRMIGGSHLAIFPEGTRNTVDHKRVQDLKPGVAIIAGKLSTESTVGIVPFGLQYRANESWRIPHIHIGTPIIDEYYDQAQLLDSLKMHMQHAVDESLDRIA
jgi:1-acyl-sn-glycerol-3-phosphate acyltransferase